MWCGATQDRWGMVERPDRMWSTGEGNGKPLQYSWLENPMNSMKRQNDRILKESVGAQYATGDQLTTEDEMVGWNHRLDGHGFEWTPGVGDGQGGLVCCGSWGLKSQTRLSN